MKAFSPGKNRDRPYTVVLKKRCWLSDRAFELEFSRPPSFEFIPGQRISLIHGSMERDYSPPSAPEDPFLTLCIRKVEEGKFTPFLATAEPGTEFRFKGPRGYFIHRPSPRQAVFVATGTGIAPFVSMARSGATEFILLHGVKNHQDLYYQAFLRAASKRYIPCLTGTLTVESEISDGYQGRVTGWMETHLLSGVYDFYLCGRIEMIRDATHLIDRRFPGSMVYSEQFF